MLLCRFNSTPTLQANAGADQGISRFNPVAILDGSASTGNIVSQVWQWIRPSDMTDGVGYNHINKPTNLITPTHFLVYRDGGAGMGAERYGHKYRLTVTDNLGNTSSDEVRLNIIFDDIPPQKGSQGDWHYVTLGTLATDLTNTGGLAAVGDYIIDGANDGFNIPVLPSGTKKTDIYLPAGLVALGPGKKLLIRAGRYNQVNLNFNDGDCEGDPTLTPNSEGYPVSTNPVIVTNYSGQVECQQYFSLKNAKYTKVTGRYQAGVSGHTSYRGHAAGAYEFSRGKYGIYTNHFWNSIQSPGFNIAGTHAEYIECEFVECGDGGFAGLYFKDIAGNDYIGCLFHDFYIHNTGGEGIYAGQTSNDPVQSLIGCKFYNNRIIETGNEACQIGQQGGGCEIKNNVIVHAANRGKTPFQDSQCFSIQLGLRNGGNKFINNIVIGSFEQILSAICYGKVGLTPNTGTIDISNNVFEYAKGFIGNFIDDRSVLPAGVILHFDNNIVGNFNTFQGAIVYTGAHAVNTNQWARLQNPTLSVTVNGLIRDNSKTTIGNYTPANTTIGSTSILSPLTDFAFANSGYGSGYNWNNYESWGDYIYGTYGDEYPNQQPGIHQGDQITYNIGDRVTWMSRYYESRINSNTGHMPMGVTDTYWTKLTWTDGITTFDYPPDDYRQAPGAYHQARGIGLLDTA